MTDASARLCRGLIARDALYEEIALARAEYEACEEDLKEEQTRVRELDRKRRQ
jgi:hypothetical protein